MKVLLLYPWNNLLMLIIAVVCRLSIWGDYWFLFCLDSLLGVSNTMRANPLEGSFQVSSSSILPSPMSDMCGMSSEIGFYLQVPGGNEDHGNNLHCFESLEYP